MRTADRAQEERRLEFVRRFVPKGVGYGHYLLYDFDRPSNFVPTDDELNECLDGYLDLLNEIPPDSPKELRDMSMMDASELTLAYLGRWRRGKEVTLDRARVEVLLKVANTLLATIIGRYGEDELTADGYKRVVRLVELLDECSR